MPYRLGVDLGTTFTAAAVSDGVGEPTVIGLGNRALQIPSVLFLKPDGEFLVGEAAERRGLTEPDRLAREFKRRIGDHVPIMVAGAPFSPQALTSHLLRWVVGAATERMGERPAEVILTHPANWGPFRLELLEQVAVMAGVGPVQRCTEPEAAAAQYAAQTRVAPGDRVAVYDLGGGTFDACVLEKTDTGFRALGTPDGVEHLGGVDFDEAVLRHVLGALGAGAAALDPDDPEVTIGLARLRRDCVEAKEALSTDVDTLVPVALPGLSTTVRVTRAEFELMIRPALTETLAAMGRALQSARVEASTLRGILLVGGSSRIPLVSELLTREFTVPTALDTHPKHDVALGSVRAGRDPADVVPAPPPSNLPPVEGSAASAPPNPARAVRPSASAPGGVARGTGSAGSPPPVEPLGAAATADAGG
ncbi:MAG TPA: Hsp70 family protein, partial [Propionibacteriaceae bacterium]|nr:Hsp70 family protein [Propionibacteriaceae bacterium]